MNKIKFLSFILVLFLIPVLAHASFMLECEGEDFQIVELGEYADFQLYLTNTGDEDEVYWLGISVIDPFPEGWSKEFWIGDQVYTDSTTVELAPSEELGIILRIYTMESSGIGWSTLTVYPIENPEEEDYVAVMVATADISADDDEYESVPNHTDLYPNYPNPFNPKTTIHYHIAEKSPVSLKIYDTLGNLINVIVDKNQAAGNYQYTWNAEDFPSGIYQAVLETKNNYYTESMILLK